MVPMRPRNLLAFLAVSCGDLLAGLFTSRLLSGLSVACRTRPSWSRGLWFA